ncbi:hypothetical protein, partial [Corallococcus terminator]
GLLAVGAVFGVAVVEVEKQQRAAQGIEAPEVSGPAEAAETADDGEASSSDAPDSNDVTSEDEETSADGEEPPPSSSEAHAANEDAEAVAGAYRITSGWSLLPFGMDGASFVIRDDVEDVVIGEFTFREGRVTPAAASSTGAYWLDLNPDGV